MATTIVTQDNLDEVTGRDGISIIDFWAPWCSACKAFAPVYEAASQANPDIVFAKADVEELPALSAMFGIHALPTIAVYRDGIRVFFQAGALPRPALDDLIEQVRALDMDQVRKDLAEHSHELGHAHH